MLLSVPLAVRAADGPYSRAAMAGGMTLVSQRTAGELAAACLFIKVGPACEDKDNNGITSLLNHVVLASHPLADVTPPVLKIEQLGGRVTVETSGCYSCFSLVVPVKNLPEALKVLADAVGNPGFSAAAVYTESASLNVRRDWLFDRLADRAFRAFMDKTYSGLSCGLDARGTKKSVDGIGKDDITRWHETYYRPSNMTLSVAANIDPAQAEKIAGLAFKGLAAASAVAARQACPVPAKGGACVKTSMYEESVSEGRAATVIGYTLPSPESSDYPALKLAAALLSDGIGSSVFRRLRESGMSAYSFGWVIPPVDGQSRIAFYVVTDPGRLGDAVAGIKSSVESLKAGNITDDEIDRARGAVLGEMALGNETASDRAWNAGYYESRGLGADYPQQLAGMVEKVGKQELMAAAGKYLNEYTQVLLTPGKAAR